jgi:hypothetical protein
VSVSRMRIWLIGPVFEWNLFIIKRWSES